MNSQLSDQDTQPVNREDVEGAVASDDQVVLGEHYSIGGRDVYEDRVRTGHVTTQSGQRLAVALVADGVGGQAQGERAAQIAVDSIFWYLRNGEEAEVPELLKRALAYANSKVYQAAEESGVKGMSTTASMAVVVNGERLFVANVGDSAVFLYRNGKLNKLTRDHTFANVKVWRGEMSAEQAAQHPKAEVVLRALGLRERVNVDVGFHVGTEEYQEANKRGKNGL
ncbi:MAG: protein phosphatase 2C domain-containing protein, partial [Anaerolineales bacterium]|nr:protein phosphatase 2C domain-containing protein [Anaerolineales bacterium]